MKNNTKEFGCNWEPCFKSNKKAFFSLFACLFLLLTVFGHASAKDSWPCVAYSADGTPIAYEVYGKGDPTLVFVHGWSCDSRYWREQIPEFSKKYRVVVLDLAGHGHSGISRTNYSSSAFGEDVKAVIEAVGSEKVILIGHSMGGAVTVEAARLMPGRVIGLIGIDTFQSIEVPLNHEMLRTIITPLEKNFQAGCREFVKQMLAPKTDPQLQEWIMSDMASAPPEVALSAMNNMVINFLTGESAGMFKDVRIPVITINGDLEPINAETNRKHMLSFEAVVIKEAGHFLMMARPAEFNKELHKAIIKLTGK
ncbi:alpha/beta fold hydrolase [Thermodesulfobacteriota bacterium]